MTFLTLDAGNFGVQHFGVQKYLGVPLLLVVKLLYMRFVSVINCNEHSKNGFQRITKFDALGLFFVVFV